VAIALLVAGEAEVERPLHYCLVESNLVEASESEGGVDEAGVCQRMARRVGSEELYFL
jgi:hypothetical protein